ncbi:hypothetical protein IWW50_000196, partial [Coemansia erecta]
MEYREVKGTKLAFKGDKRKSSKQDPDKCKEKDKRRSKKKKQHSHNTQPNTTTAEPSWSFVQTLGDLNGPLAFYFRTEHVYTLSLAPTSATQTQTTTIDVGPPEFHRVDNMGLTDIVPSRVEQVFVARRSVPTDAASSSERDMRSFKSCRNTYLAADHHGVVTCNAMAIGALEVWTPVLVPERGEGAVALKIRPPGCDEDRFLGIDELDRESDTPRVK